MRTARRLTPVLAVGVTCAAGLALSASALAGPAPAWTERIEISKRRTEHGSLAVAAGSGQTNAIIWSAIERGTKARSARRGFGAIRNVGRPGIEDVSLTISGGRARATWQEKLRGRWFSSSAPINGRWTTPKVTRTPSGGGASITENARGQAISAWSGTRGRAGDFSEGGSLWVSYRASRGAKWSPPRRLRRNTIGAIALIDATGRASVVTTVQQPGATTRSGEIREYRRQSKTRWVSTGIPGAELATLNGAAMSQGRTVGVAFSTCPAGFDRFQCSGETPLYASVRSARGGYSDPQALDRDAEDQSIEVVVDPQNRATVVWANATTVKAATTSDGGATWPATDIGAAAGSFDLPTGVRVVVNRRSTVLAAFVAEDGLDVDSVWVAARDRSGSWGPTVRLSIMKDSALIYLPTPALNDSGRALVVYSQEPSSRSLEAPVWAHRAVIR